MIGRPPFDADAIRALATILAETGLTEIEVSDKDRRLRVARVPAPAAPSPAVTYAVPAPAPTVAPAVQAAAKPAEDAAETGTVTSPMVGVAYLSPEPGSPPYIQVGQTVQAGQTVLLIEAMKTFNQIKAPRAGTVRQILISAGQPVEYDEPLVILE